MTDKFTPDWPHGHETVEGWPAEIFCERDGMLWGRVYGPYGISFSSSWKMDGKSRTLRGRDLRNRPDSSAVKPIFEERDWLTFESGIMRSSIDEHDSARAMQAYGAKAEPVYVISKSLAETGREEFFEAVCKEFDGNKKTFPLLRYFLSKNPDWLIFRRPK